MTDLLEGKIMGIFGFHKLKKDKRAWALALYGKRLRNPEMVSEEELSVITTGMLMQHLRIIRESVSIINKTNNSDTRQGRIELCRKHLQNAKDLEAFCDKEQLAIVNQL